MTIKRVVPAALVAVIAGGGAAGAVAITDASAHAVAHAAADTLSAKKLSVGTVLVNSAGKTIYVFALDKKGSGKTACNTACLAVWPLVTTTGKVTEGPGVNSKLVTTYKVGGKTAVAYNGYPLYTYVGDSKAGEDKGQNLNANGGYWWVINASTGAIIK